ncbi:heme ABC transporter ATP-binding protein [Nocardioides sambongensis]|uniref:heme ABC transporter ATP-binding protein n=1 Tax=Nocardioides sambongensis TaxID=2589074 RepID=UPI001E5D05F7|nr:heme ABC transporter ATP-binding protein [Nocardioides sambongensis]
MSTVTDVPLLEARDATVVRGGSRILDGVTVGFSAGELVVLVGPNGAGKSTLLGVLAGDLDPDEGTALLSGRRLDAYGARDLARRRAVLLQHQGLAFGFQVKDVVAMGRAPWHRTAAADRDEEMVGEAMRRAEVVPFAERLFPTLSGGEQSRSSFARVLAQDTPIVMLDEPTAALDIRHQEALLRVARQEARQGALVVVVLHDLSLAAAYADRICLLAGGRLRADGTPRDVLDDELLSEVYQHPVRVIDHDGIPVVLPVREGLPCAP